VRPTSDRYGREGSRFKVPYAQSSGYGREGASKGKQDLLVDDVVLSDGTDGDAVEEILSDEDDPFYSDCSPSPETSRHESSRQESSRQESSRQEESRRDSGFLAESVSDAEHPSVTETQPSTWTQPESDPYPSTLPESAESVQNASVELAPRLAGTEEPASTFQPERSTSMASEDSRAVENLSPGQGRADEDDTQRPTQPVDPRLSSPYLGIQELQPARSAEGDPSAMHRSSQDLNLQARTDSRPQSRQAVSNSSPGPESPAFAQQERNGSPEPARPDSQPSGSDGRACTPYTARLEAESFNAVAAIFGGLNCGLFPKVFETAKPPESTLADCATIVPPDNGNRLLASPEVNDAAQESYAVDYSMNFEDEGDDFQDLHIRHARNMAQLSPQIKEVGSANPEWGASDEDPDPGDDFQEQLSYPPAEREASLEDVPGNGSYSMFGDIEDQPAMVPLRAGTTSQDLMMGYDEGYEDERAVPIDDDEDDDDMVGHEDEDDDDDENYDDWEYLGSDLDDDGDGLVLREDRYDDDDYSDEEVSALSQPNQGVPLEAPPPRPSAPVNRPQGLEPDSGGSDYEAEFDNESEDD